MFGTCTRTRCHVKGRPEYTRVPREPKDLKAWLRATWAAFSEMIRLEAADAHGYCQCVTCDSPPLLWNRGVQAGHFLAYRYPHSPVRFEETNVHAQCRDCNMGGLNASFYGQRVQGTILKRESVQIRYTAYMLDRYGMEEIERLQRLRATGRVNYTVELLREMRAGYQQRADQAREEKGL